MTLGLVPQDGPNPLPLRALDDSTLFRQAVVRPGMSGSTALFLGEVGDWTWEGVSALCGTDVFRARNASGQPTYLAFYYIHVRAGQALHPLGLTFGYRIDVVSRHFDFGSESVLAVHRISRCADMPTPPRPFAADEPYDRPQDGCIYVENFNRWVTRERPDHNVDLVRSSPIGFTHAHLPKLPDQFSPRRAYDLARRQQSFEPEAAPELERFEIDYRIDVSRDVNAVGLIYFASYFSIIDWALLQFWRHLGRDDRAFLARILIDQKMCYMGNADLDTVLTISLSLRRPAGAGTELFDVVLWDRTMDRTIAVSTLTFLAHPEEVAKG